jgi:hypothetical protein
LHQYSVFFTGGSRITHTDGSVKLIRETIPGPACVTP